VGAGTNIIPGTSSFILSSCAGNDLLQQTFTLTSPARIYASSVGIYSPGNSFGGEGSKLELIDESSNTVVAESQTYIQDFGDLSNTGDVGRQLVAVSEILRAAPASGPASPIFVAPPGTYTLRLHLEASGVCAAQVTYQGNLTYLLLAGS
jgi:hypothetical protein